MSFHFVFVTNFIRDKNPLYGSSCEILLAYNEVRSHCAKFQNTLRTLTWKQKTVSGVPYVIVIGHCCYSSRILILKSML